MFRSTLVLRSSINLAFIRRSMQKNTFLALYTKIPNISSVSVAATRRPEHIINLTKSVHRFYSAKRTNGNKVYVIQDPYASQFYIELDDKRRAYLDYRIVDGRMILLCTTVPPDLQGRGLERILAKTALEHVVEHKLKLQIDCEFVRHYVNTYEPKYKVFISK